MKKSNAPSGLSLQPEFKETVKRIKDREPDYTVLWCSLKGKAVVDLKECPDGTWKKNGAGYPVKTGRNHKEKKQKACAKPEEENMSENFPECPLSMHNNCKEFYNPKVCAIARKEKVCLLKHPESKKAHRELTKAASPGKRPFRFAP